MAKWTKEQTNILRSLWGKKTSSAIAKELGCFTRNAVIGKASRLKLSEQGKAAEAEAASPSVCSISKLYKEICSHGNNIAGGKAACQWPKGEPDEATFSFCGHEVQEGESYCSLHCNSAYKRRVR